MLMVSRQAASKFIPFALAALLPVAAAAQTARPEAAGVSTTRLARVSELVDRYIKAGEVTGGVTLVARNGRIVWLQAQGEADREKKTPMQKDTIFRIASMTKPVTGVAILMLVEEGKIRLTDPLSRFIPAFKDLKVNVTRPPAAPLALPAPGAAPPPAQTFPEPAAREVTILDVLTHTSGIMSGPVSLAAGRALEDARGQIGLKWTEQLPPCRWNSSRARAGRIARERGSTCWRTSSRSSRGRTSTSSRHSASSSRSACARHSSGRQPRSAHGSWAATRRQRSGLTPRENPDALSSETYFSGAGGLMSTAESYARFAMMLANGGRVERCANPESAHVELMGSAFIPDTLPGRPPGEGYGLSVRVVTDR